MSVTALRPFQTHHHLVGRYPGWQIDLHHLPRRPKPSSGC